MIKREKRQTAKTESGTTQFTFRIPISRTEQFGRVRELVEALYELYKKTQKEDEKVVNRNDIIIEALEIGLKQLKRDSK